MSGFLTLSPETTEWTDEGREDFLRAHVEEIYEELTDGFSKALRDQELLGAAAERYPGLVPSPAQMAAESERRLADKLGLEIAQGLFLSHVLASPRAGAHLVWAMLRPTARGPGADRRLPRRRRRRPRHRPRCAARGRSATSSSATRAT